MPLDALGLLAWRILIMGKHVSNIWANISLSGFSNVSKPIGWEPNPDGSRHYHIRQWEVTLVDLWVIQAPVWGQIAIYLSVLKLCDVGSWKRSCFRGSLRFWWIQQVSENHLLDNTFQGGAAILQWSRLLPSSISRKNHWMVMFLILEEKWHFPWMSLHRFNVKHTKFIF